LPRPLRLGDPLVEAGQELAPSELLSRNAAELATGRGCPHWFRPGMVRALVFLVFLVFVGSEEIRVVEGG
jgi:hypothetical protein